MNVDDVSKDGGSGGGVGDNSDLQDNQSTLGLTHVHGSRALASANVSEAQKRVLSPQSSLNVVKKLPKRMRPSPTTPSSDTTTTIAPNEDASTRRISQRATRPTYKRRENKGINSPSVIPPKQATASGTSAYSLVCACYIIF